MRPTSVARTHRLVMQLKMYQVLRIAIVLTSRCVRIAKSIPARASAACCSSVDVSDICLTRRTRSRGPSCRTLALLRCSCSSSMPSRPVLLPVLMMDRFVDPYNPD